MKTLCDEVRAKLGAFIIQAESNQITIGGLEAMDGFILDVVSYGYKGIYDYSDEELLKTFLVSFCEEDKLDPHNRAQDYFPCFDFNDPSSCPSGCTMNPDTRSITWDGTDDLYDWVTTKIVQMRLTGGLS